MSDKRKAEDMQKRVKNMRRNVLIYLGKITDHGLSRQRVDAINKQVKKLIKDGIVDISLFE